MQMRRWCVGLAMIAAIGWALAACGDDSTPENVDVEANNNAADDSGTDDAGANNANNANNATPDTPDATPDTPEPAGEITHRSVVPDGVRPDDAARLIVLGDSISAGVGAPRGEAYFNLLRENASGSWPGFDAVDLGSSFGHEVPLVSVAVSGATTRTMWRDQVPALREIAAGGLEGPSIVVITIGGNDLTTGFAAGADLEGDYLEETLGYIRSTLEVLQDPALFPDGTAIFLANVYDPGDGVGQVDSCFGGLDLSPASEALLLWARRYVDLAYDFNIGIIDALGAFRGHGFYSGDAENAYYDATDPTLWFNRDCIHPNPRGHHELRRLFFEAIDGSYTAD